MRRSIFKLLPKYKFMGKHNPNHVKGVVCWVSRAMEKTIFLRFMFAMCVLSIAMTVIELYQLSWKPCLRNYLILSTSWIMSHNNETISQNFKSNASKISEETNGIDWLCWRRKNDQYRKFFKVFVVVRRWRRGRSSSFYLVFIALRRLLRFCCQIWWRNVLVTDVAVS